MKRRIFGSIFFTSFIISLITVFLIAFLMYSDSVELLKEQMKAELEYLKTGYELGGEDYLHSLDSDVGGRITLILTDGTVIYDSSFDVEGMENHQNREEVKEASQTGSGAAVRYSQTNSEDMHYYAVKLNDESIMRISNTTSSMYRTIINAMPWIIAISALIAVVAIIVANRQSKYILDPINNLDFNNPLKGKVYEELSPFLEKLDYQNKEIKMRIEQLKIRQTEFSATIENINEGLIIVDKDAQVLVCNNAAKIFCEYGENQTKGKSVYELNKGKKFKQSICKSLKGERSEFNKNSDELYLRYFVNPVIVSGEISGAVVIIVDETEKQNREALRREFSANVSHELKTPLTSISGYAEIMKNGLVKPEDMGLFSTKIYNEAQRLIMLIQDIIKLSSIDEGSEMPKDPVELLSLARGVEESLRDTQKKADVNIFVEGTAQTVYGVSVMLGEMLYNLCDNAIKYNVPGGIVSVNVSTENEMAVLSVKDTGIGIAENEKDRIFERFYRVDKSHSKQTGGTGLGLSIVKHCVQFHGGKIHVDSVCGKGTTVTVSLPLMKR